MTQRYNFYKITPRNLIEVSLVSELFSPQIKPYLKNQITLATATIEITGEIYNVIGIRIFTDDFPQDMDPDSALNPLDPSTDIACNLFAKIVESYGVYSLALNHLNRERQVDLVVLPPHVIHFLVNELHFVQDYPHESSALFQSLLHRNPAQINTPLSDNLVATIATNLTPSNNLEEFTDLR